MQLSEFKNKHLGRLAFVLGSGPSLHTEKLDGIVSFVTFAVNASVIKHRKADYFVSDWAGAMDWDYYHKTLPNFSGISFLPRKRFDEFSHHIKNRVLYEGKEWFDPFTRKRDPKALYISDDIASPIVSSRSSCGAAVHLAYLMGCNPIVLLGNDCCHMGERTHFYQFPGEHKPVRYRGHQTPISKKTMMRGRTLDDENREVIDYWSNLGKSNPHLNVINSSSQTLLDCFPKMALVDVLSRYASITR